MKKRRKTLSGMFIFSFRDAAVTAVILAAALGLCLLLRMFEHTDSFAAMLFILAVMLVARFTNGYLFGIVSAVLGVLAVNYVFTYPYFKLNFTLAGYPLTILCMLSVSLITSALTTKAKMQEQFKLEMEREKTRSNLLRAVSHDLRTPLTAILGADSALMENGDSLSPEDRQKLLAGIHEESEWLIRVVENLLSVTRIDSGDPAGLIKQPEAAEELAAEAVQKFRYRFPEEKVSVTVPEELVMVPVDALLIEQVIINLLENAALHAEGSKLTKLTVCREGGRAVFRVTDHGRGIPPERLETIFDGKWTGDRERQPGRRSMGIGLSVCSSIVKAHGGTMSAANLKGGGAEFKFTLPMGEN